MLLFLVACAVFHAAFAYDSMLQYNPQGRVLQIDRAMKRVEKGGAVIGIQCSDGVILVTVPSRGKLPLRLNHPQKLFRVDDHVSIGVAGMLSDAPMAIEVARRICVKYKNEYNTWIPLETLAADLADSFHSTTRKMNARCFGASLVIAGVEGARGAQVFSVEPDGGLHAWRGICIGRGCHAIMQRLHGLSELGARACWERLRPLLDEELRDKGGTEDLQVQVSFGLADDEGGAVSWSNFVYKPLKKANDL